MSIPIDLEDKIKRIVNLPTLPQIASNLLGSINDSKSSSRDIATIISQDLSLSAKILRLSNSVFYGMPRTIANINEAVVILGFKVIYTLVLSLTVFDMFPDHSLSIKFDRKQFWKHSILCGVISRLIASKIPKNLKINPDDAFCAGLLHDIGKIVMEQYLHDDLHKAIDYSKKRQLSYFESEKTILGYSHPQVTKLLIARWNLPDILHSPLVFHHTPEEFLVDTDLSKIKPHVIQTFICHMADYLSFDESVQEGDSIEPAPPFNEEILDLIGLGLDDMEEIRKNLPEQQEQMKEFIGIFS